MTFLIIFLSIVVLFIISVMIGGFILSGPGYKGPTSEHFDGKTFINLNGARAKGFKDVLKWMVKGREKRVWKEDTTPSKDYDLPPIETERCRASFINHSTFYIEAGGIHFLTDPIWSKYASPFQFAGPKRMRQPGFTLSSLGKVDYILLSHNHYDHLDLPALKKIDQLYGPKIITTLGVDLFLREKGFQNVVALDWWQEIDLGEMIITCTPAQHFSSRGLFDRDQTLWCGFTIKNKHHHIYYVGDSGYGPFFKNIGSRLGPFDLSIIPIGAYKPEWFMHPIHVNPDQAVQIHRDVKSQKSIACHFGTFPLADDSMHDPIEGLKVALQNDDKIDFSILEHGESVVV